MSAKKAGKIYKEHAYKKWRRRQFAKTLRKDMLRHMQRVVTASICKTYKQYLLYRERPNIFYAPQLKVEFIGSAGKLLPILSNEDKEKILDKTDEMMGSLMMHGEVHPYNKA